MDRATCSCDSPDVICDSYSRSGSPIVVCYFDVCCGESVMLVDSNLSFILGVRDAAVSLIFGARS